MKTKTSPLFTVEGWISWKDVIASQVSESFIFMNHEKKQIGPLAISKDVKKKQIKDLLFLFSLLSRLKFAFKV